MSLKIKVKMLLFPNDANRALKLCTFKTRGASICFFICCQWIYTRAWFQKPRSNFFGWGKKEVRFSFQIRFLIICMYSFLKAVCIPWFSSRIRTNWLWTPQNHIKWNRCGRGSISIRNGCIKIQINQETTSECGSSIVIRSQWLMFLRYRWALQKGLGQSATLWKFALINKGISLWIFLYTKTKGKRFAASATKRSQKLPMDQQIIEAPWKNCLAEH